jgi:hypothetical protein
MVGPETNLEELRTKIAEYIERFETQSGTPEERSPEMTSSSRPSCSSL